MNDVGNENLKVVGVAEEKAEDRARMRWMKKNNAISIIVMLHDGRSIDDDKDNNMNNDIDNDNARATLL